MAKVMTKDETVSELKSRGFDAFLENGVVMINMPITSNKINQVERLLKSINYRASWGVRNSEINS